MTPDASPSTGSRSFISRLRNGDEIARLVTLLFASTVVLVVLLLVLQLWHDSSVPRHKFGFEFFATRVWDPIAEQFGALPFIYGTLVTALLSTYWLRCPASFTACLEYSLWSP
jgi:phosphate transport system permease protein